MTVTRPPAPAPRSIVAPFVEEAAKAHDLFWLAILMRYQWVSRISGIVLAGPLRGSVRLHREHPLLRPRLPVRRADLRRGAPVGGAAAALRLPRRADLLRPPPVHLDDRHRPGRRAAVQEQDRPGGRAAGRLSAPRPSCTWRSTPRRHWSPGRACCSSTSVSRCRSWPGSVIFVVRQLFREGRLIRERLTDYVRVGWLPEGDPAALVPAADPDSARCGTRLFRGPDAFLATIRLQRAADRAGLPARRDDPGAGRPGRAGPGEGAAGQDPGPARALRWWSRKGVRSTRRSGERPARHRLRTHRRAFPAPPGSVATTRPRPPLPPGVPAAAAVPLGQTATQYSEVDPNWKPPGE